MLSGLILAVASTATQTAGSPPPALSFIQVVGAAGAGALLGSLISNGVLLWNSRRQRTHELLLRDRQFRHELRMNRLDRLQEDFATLMLAVHDLGEAATMFVTERRRSLDTLDSSHDTGAKERYKSGRERFEIARARLVLDPDGDIISRLVGSITEQVQRYDDLLEETILSREMDDLGDEVDISVVEEEIGAQRDLLVTRVNDPTGLARGLLDQLRRQSLEEDAISS